MQRTIDDCLKSERCKYHVIPEFQSFFWSPLYQKVVDLELFNDGRNSITLTLLITILQYSKCEAQYILWNYDF